MKRMVKGKEIIKINIGWLYPEEMSTYGDRGNIIVLRQRCLWRSINVRILKIRINTPLDKLKDADLIIGGGAQDRQQEIILEDLQKKKALVLRRMFKNGTPGLFVCGSPQLLGKFYITGQGRKLRGLNIFDFYTKHPGINAKRLIGNAAGILLGDNLFRENKRRTIVGFENHGGRTYPEKNFKPFAQVLSGFGNNGQDGYEGSLYNNVIGCYYHGPFLSKNPHIADWLICKALEVKYKRNIFLSALNDELEWKAHDYILKKLGLYD